MLLLKHLETAPFKKAHKGNIRLVRDPAYKTLSQMIDNLKDFFSYRLSSAAQRKERRCQIPIDAGLCAQNPCWLLSLLRSRRPAQPQRWSSGLRLSLVYLRLAHRFTQRKKCLKYHLIYVVPKLVQSSYPYFLFPSWELF